MLTDGTLDTSWSGNGKGDTDLGGNDYAYELLLQPDNKLVAVGASDPNEFALARYNVNGTLDTTFSSDGKVTTVFGGASAGAFQTDGKIVAAGTAASDFAAARYQNTPPATATPTVTSNTATRTVTRTATTGPSATRTATAIPTSTPTVTHTPTNTNTPLPTQTTGGPTATTEPTHTSTNTPSITPSMTPTELATGTPTGEPGTATNTPTNEPGGTATPTSCSIQFADVPPNNTFYANIRCLACQGIINGYVCGGAGEPCNGNNDPYFRPGNQVTRGQIAKIASNSAGFNDPISGQTFEDVAPGSTFYDFVERLVSRGVMNGYACGGAGEPCVPPFNRPIFPSEFDRYKRATCQDNI